MVYDCFPFFNELDLLEIRLAELYDTVDRFVIVEATKTFQKKPKPLNFRDNEKRYTPYADKITYIVLDDFPHFFSKFRVPTSWDISNYQKNAITRGLNKARPGDVIIISDLDEIPNAKKILEYKDKPGIKVFEQRLYNYFLNCLAVKGPPDKHLVQRGNTLYWKGSVMLNFSNYTQFGKLRLHREKTDPEICSIREGGWHFSCLGGYENVMYKLRSYEHANEAQYYYHPENDLEKLKNKIEKGEDLFDRAFSFVTTIIDETYPLHIRNNQKKYEHLVKKA